MEAPNPPKDGLLGPARVDRSGRPATTPHATGGGGWPVVSVRVGGGGALCGGPGCGLGVAVGASARGARGALVLW